MTEILQFADQLVFSQTGKHLDDLQETVVKGVWQGQTYAEIGDQCHRSESRVRDVGYKLWEILSEGLGEDISKYNFRATFERLRFVSSQVININTIDIKSIESSQNFCSYSNSPFNSDQKNLESEQSTLFYSDLKQAPKISDCFVRMKEIESLSQLLKNPNTRLISVLGNAGIGKSTLVRKLLENNAQSFEIVIWKNINLYPSLEIILTEILAELSLDNNEQKANILYKQFLNLLTTKRCLIILDNFQQIFAAQQFAGQYKPKYAGFKAFLKMLTEIEHQSCFILISQEKCQEVLSRNQESCHCLELSGLDHSDKQILDGQGLKNPETWPKLIEKYEGNPQYLRYITVLIQDIFNGEIEEFLEEEELILPEDLKNLLESIWLRLSLLEQNILLEIVKHGEFAFRKKIKESLAHSSTEVSNGLQSLKRRFLLIQQENDQKLLCLCPIWKEYLRLKVNAL